MKAVLTSEIGENTRRYDNDWLTVGAMLVIFFIVPGFSILKIGM